MTKTPLIYRIATLLTFKNINHFFKKQGGAMLIRVVYKDNVHDYVKDFQLGSFLDAGEIIKFCAAPGG
jgi:hypothetical protein